MLISTTLRHPERDEVKALSIILKGVRDQQDEAKIALVERKLAEAQQRLTIHA